MKKGQAAMEFLMTYGWAILVVLAAIGALAYFGVLSPDRFLPSKCVAQPPFACTEFKVTGTNVTVELQNNGGVDMDSVTVVMTCGNDATATASEEAAGLALANGAEQDFTFDDSAGCAATAGQRFKGNYTITYQQSGADQTHTTSGTIQARGE